MAKTVIRKIRARASPEKQRDLAIEFGVSEAHVSGIVSGRKRAQSN